MSIFASQTTATVHPGDDRTASIVVQKLGGYACEVAQAAHAQGVFNGFTGRGWANKFYRSLQAGTATEAEAVQALADPLIGFDRLQVVRLGIQSWSFTVEIDGKTAPMPINDTTVHDIDDDTLDQLAIEIMRLTKPDRFKNDQDPEPASL